ncbi:hypothetical protein FOL47_002710, partial [Perkinsus chesapeaki]
LKLIKRRGRPPAAWQTSLKADANLFGPCKSLAEAFVVGKHSLTTHTRLEPPPNTNDLPLFVRWGKYLDWQANPSATVPMSRVKSYVSALDLFQRKLEKLAGSVNGDSKGSVFPGVNYKLNFVLRDHYVVPKDILNFVCKHLELPSSSNSGSSSSTEEQIVHELKPLEQRFHLLFSCDDKQRQFLAGTSCNGCWICGIVERKCQRGNVFALESGE